MLAHWLPHYQGLIQSAIQHCFSLRHVHLSGVENTFQEALRYAVEGGGKRLRTVLASISYEYYSGQSVVPLLPSFIGIECIHAYTLVHDDLPCMDNDEIRRGKPTVWKAYGETMAVLVGDALQTMGIELLADSGDIRIVREITRALGDMGVVRGQVRDTMIRHDTLSLEELLRIHDEKTGIFIAASLVIGAYAARAGDAEVTQMREFGMLLGRAFQIQDDILDVEGNASEVGKKVGKDVEIGKGIVALVGLESAKKLLADLEKSMLAMVEHFDDEKFRDIVQFVVHRAS